MFIKKLSLKLSLLPLIILFPLGLFSNVENSIIPFVENYEIPGNISSKKYSNNQYIDIMQGLGRVDEKIRLVSYNILGDDQDPFQHDITHAWEHRFPRVLTLLLEMRPDIITVQELSEKQFVDLYPYLEEWFDFYGEPRLYDMEMNGIFYRRDRFAVTKQTTIPIKEKKSKPNLAITLQLYDRLTKKNFAVFNTHLTFDNPDIREYEIRFIKELMRPVAKQMPVILTGDLNTFANRPDLDRLPFFDGDYLHQILTEDLLHDARQVSLLGHVGPIATYTNANKYAEPFLGKGTPGIFLDHIYVSKDVTVLIHAVEPATVDRQFPSDHMPVLMDFIIK